MSFLEVPADRYGLVTKQEIGAQAGLWALRRAVGDGYLLPVGSDTGVYRVAGTPSTFRQRALACCLACGPPVSVSHRSAAVLWGIEAVAPQSDIEVTLPEGRSARRRGFVVHRSRWADGEQTFRHGIPVTSPARTLTDLAGVVPPTVLERALDEVLRRRHATVDTLRPPLEAMEAARRPGSGVLWRLLDARATTGVPDSEGVARVLEWIDCARLPAPVCDHYVQVGGRVRWIDIAYPDRLVAVEFNGWGHHQMRSRMDDDHARTTELELAGWLVIVVTWAHDEATTVDRIRRALELRRPRTSGHTR